MGKHKKPLVSFLLPVYNAEAYLTETLHSIIEQTYDNFEVIAINDGSSDRSLEILHRYSAFDPRIKVYSRRNKGLVATLNEAIGKSSGALLARIDSDDLCVPRRIEWQVDAMLRNPKAALCYGYYEVFSEDGEFLAKEFRHSQQDDIKRYMYFGNPIAHASVMLRKKFIPPNPYNPNVGPTEDFELWTRLAAKFDFVCVQKMIIRYRINTSGIMHTIGQQQHVHMKRNIDKYWKLVGSPQPRSSRIIRDRMKLYMRENVKTGLGPHMVRMLIENEIRLASSCYGRGQKGLGIKIFRNTMFSSKTGFKFCTRKIIDTTKSKIKILR